MANNLRVIGFVAVLIALVAVFGSQFVSTQITGFAVGSQQCQGTPILDLTPSPASSGSIVTARVTGLTGCEGRTVALHKDNCFGPALDSLRCQDNDCSAVGHFSYSATGDYKIAACIDKNNNGYLYDPGERSVVVLNVRDLPDLAITELKLPRSIRNVVPFQPIAVVENLGTARFNLANIYFDLYKEVQTSKYVATKQETLVLSWPESAPTSASVRSPFYVSLPPGGKQEVLMRSLSLTPGDYRLVVRGTWNSIYRTDNTAVEELSKTNNQLEKTFTVV